MAPNPYAFAGSFLRPALYTSHHRFSNVSTIPSSLVNRTHPVRYVAIAGPPRVPAIMRPLVPSQELRHFVEDTVHPRSTVLKILNAYVKEHNLQDPQNRKIVRCDERLKSLFGVDHCTIIQMSKYITPHLSKPELVGGKYVDEAKTFEENYVRMKIAAAAENPSPKPKRKSRKRSPATPGSPKPPLVIFRPVLLSPELSAICRQKKELPRQDIVKSVWEYIRLNNLQGGPGKPIRCDYLLKKVYDTDFIDVKTVMKGISAHVTKIE